ncbi:MAG: hypothetical protein CVU49_01660 [Candidatus Cloacimonetes bacterium HGW-Cloacimonetes-2]|jgi:hypothetical protein|nr:MAG: hypothetical protein CVU49_01660 [Candidatus Cloacimonetes bacterium HGW-Cloacimonetes-2]
MKRRIIIFGIILLVLIAAYFVLSRNSNTDNRQRVFNADSLQIGKITVMDFSDTLQLEQTENGWRITDPVKWEANQEHMKNFFKSVINANYPKTEMTSSEDAIERYGLTKEKALQVITYDKKGRKQDHVYFNNFGNSWDYFRYEGESKIYQIYDSVSNIFRPVLTNWRSPVLVRIWEDELKSIEVTYPKNSYTLVHEPKRWVYRDKNVAFEIPAENRPLLRILNLLINLDTMSFFDGDNSRLMPAFENPLAVVKLNKTDDTVTTLSFAYTDETQHLMMIDDKSDPLYGVVNDSILRFTIHAEYFRQLPYGQTPPPPLDE